MPVTVTFDDALLLIGRVVLENTILTRQVQELEQRLEIKQNAAITLADLQKGVNTASGDYDALPRAADAAPPMRIERG